MVQYGKRLAVPLPPMVVRFSAQALFKALPLGFINRSQVLCFFVATVAVALLSKAGKGHAEITSDATNVWYKGLKAMKHCGVYTTNHRRM